MLAKYFINGIQPVLVIQALFVMSLSAWTVREAPFLSYLGFYLIAHYFLVGSYAFGFIDLMRFLEVYFQVHWSLYFIFYMRYCIVISDFWLGIVDDIYTLLSFHPMTICLFVYIFFRVKLPPFYQIKKVHFQVSYSDLSSFPDAHFIFSLNKYVFYIIIALIAFFTIRICLKAVFSPITAFTRILWGTMILYFFFLSIFLPSLIYFICFISLDPNLSMFQISDTRFQIYFYEILFYKQAIPFVFNFNPFTLGLISVFLLFFLLIVPCYLYSWAEVTAEPLLKAEATALAAAFAEAEALARAEEAALALADEAAELAEAKAEAEALAKKESSIIEVKNILVLDSKQEGGEPEKIKDSKD